MMFERLRNARPLLMGLSILGVAFFHAPISFHNPWLLLIHDVLYCGVDMFLFLSGLGACHSIARRGGRDYLRQRAIRILPGLMPFLLVWSLVMLALGVLDLPSFFGSITLVGWWLGNPLQLNWYFSAVWMFFLLAVPVYRLMQASPRPLLPWLGLTAAAVLLGILCPAEELTKALSRLPVFFTGMLFGLLEQRDFRRENLLRAISLLAMLPGLGLMFFTFWGPGYDLGYRLGLWWYPFALIVPGAAVLIADLSAQLGRFRLIELLERPLRRLGESSAEVLMVHVGLYKLLRTLGSYRNRVWLVILAVCLVLGCLYRQFVAAPLTEKAKKFCERY